MKSRTRREFISTASLAFGAALGFEIGRRPAARRRLGADRLVLLGTRGGPFISGYAPSPPANLLVYRNIPYVIDAGYGVTFKLIEAGLSLPALRHIFITHHHSDHNLELGPAVIQFLGKWIAHARRRPRAGGSESAHRRILGVKPIRY